MKEGTAGLILLGGITTLSIFLSIGRSQEQVPVVVVDVPDSTPFEKTLRNFDVFLRESLDSLGTVGAAATIVHAKDKPYTLTYGVKKVDTEDSVDLNTVFRLASVSKGFAGVLACQLDEQGKLPLDAHVNEYLRDFELKDSVNTNDLSIRHLLNHTSGLVPHAYDNLAEAGQGIGDILPRLKEVDIAAPPGRLYGYQNVLFSLIDTIAALGTNKPYADLLSEYIFRPLGMKNASVGFGSLVWNPNTAFPHYSRNGEFFPLPLHSGYYNLLPAAGVNASIEDVGKWLKALLGHPPAALSAAVLQKISSPQVETPLRNAYTRHWDPIDGRYYSFGWRIFDYKGYRIMYHGGYVRGYRAEIAFCPELDLGLAFLQNSPNGIASRFVPNFLNLYLEALSEDSSESPG